MLNKFVSTPKNKALLYMHVAIFLWGFTGILGRGIDLSEGVLVWYRMLLCAGSLFLSLFFQKASFKISQIDFIKLAGIGIVITIHWLLFYGAIKYSNVSITLSMMASSALFTSLLEPFVAAKKWHWREIILGFLAMLGIWFIFSFETHYRLGVLLGLLASFFGSFFPIFNKKMVEKISVELVLFYEIIIGFTLLTLLLPVYIHIFKPAKLIPSGLDWLQLFMLAILCTHIAILFSLKALKSLSAFTLNLSVNLEPVYGITLAFLIYHENQHLHAGFWLGALLILLSVGLHSYFITKE